jgi:pilus assembly protein CpaD
MKKSTIRLARPISATLTILALGGSLAACAPGFDNYDVAPTTEKRPVAEWTTSELAIHFQPGNAHLVAGEDQRIAAALAKEDPLRPVRVIARTNAAGTAPKLAVDRAAALRDVVAAKGYQVEYQGPKAAGGGATLPDPTEPNAAILYVAHYEVSVPGCPDWRKPGVSDYSNANSSNFGCANAQNLALMIADPGDLAKGETLANADGGREAKAINDYRLGKQPVVGKPDLPPINATKQLTTNN